ncbi:MAG: rod shape-determining protein MreC [Bacteroidetes bacterium]|nr:MAG: rod shape-determining protein MreC [Bacteroidota bacterium]
MKALILFIWKHSFFFLFLILEGIAAFFIVSNNSYQRSTFINASNGFTAGILSSVNNFTHYIDLVETNEKLAEENARLQNLLPSSQIHKLDDGFKIDSSNTNQQYLFQSAEIISNSFQKRNNYLFLNKGKLAGVKAGMGVISSDGIVGIIKDVSENFSTVISVLHSKSAIDVKIKRNGYTGTLKWDGKDYTLAKVMNIPSHVHLELGDSITTSGNSSIFPDNVMIGTIKNFDLKNGASFYDIQLQFTVNYNKIRYVYIVDNRLKDELEELKKHSEDE